MVGTLKFESQEEVLSGLKFLFGWTDRMTRTKNIGAKKGKPPERVGRKASGPR
jgi:hypothetical protein